MWRSTTGVFAALAEPGHHRVEMHVVDALLGRGGRVDVPVATTARLPDLAVLPAPVPGPDSLSKEAGPFACQCRQVVFGGRPLQAL